MHFSPHSLHPSVVDTATHQEHAGRQLEAIKAKRRAAAERAAVETLAESVTIPLTTVSLAGNFDAWIEIQFPTSGAPLDATLLVDSGNSQLIVPNGEDLVGLPDYTILGTGTEPWGCPSNIVQGPIQIPTSDGGVYTLKDCIFYACTANNPQGQRTANFGAGRPTPWSANGWNVVDGYTLQAPLSYNTAYPYAELDYAPAESVFSDSDMPTVDATSSLVVYASQPGGYTMLDTIRNLEWMSVVPESLTIGTTQTQWPGTVRSPIAMVDSGGGPTFLSDPNGYVYPTQWPDPAICPGWTSTSQDCNCTSDDFTLKLLGASGTKSFAYTVDTSRLPPSVRGLTLVMCKVNAFMMGQQGMNIGGVSALFNYFLIDYAGSRIGFKAK